MDTPKPNLDSAPPVPIQPATTPAQPAAAVPSAVITPGANTMPVAPIAPNAVKKTSKFQLPNFKELLAKIKALPLKFKILGGFVLLLVVLLILVSFTKTGKQVTQRILATPTPIPTTAPVGDVFEPSPYATDPDILGLEKQLNEFDGQLGGTDLREDKLRVPNLDWDINFKKQ